MPRGEHPNSRANLKRGKQFNADTARKAGKKSVQAKTIYKSLNEDLKERMTAERVAELNEKLILMAKHGNLHAYELIRDGLGEKPNDKTSVNMTVSEGNQVIAYVPDDGRESNADH
jgi:hypothetical protein